jgi:hypothetical protein
MKSENVVHGRETHDTYNLVVHLHPWVCIRGPECHFEVNEDASIAFRRTVRPKENVVVRNVSVEDPNAVVEESLMAFREGIRIGDDIT